MSFWEFSLSNEAAGPLVHEIFPDGCVSLFHHRNDLMGIKQAAFTGLNTSAISTLVSPGDVFWGMRISPAACGAILRTDASSLCGRRLIEAGEFPHLTSGTSELLEGAENFGDAIAAFEQGLERAGVSNADADPVAAAAVSFIENRAAEFKIRDVAAHTGVGVRQFERRFKAASGLTPKQYTRIRRLRATAVFLVEQSGATWADRAAEMGFTDQAHLTHEFTSLTKRSPNAFAKKVRKIEHGHLVK